MLKLDDNRDSTLSHRGRGSKRPFVVQILMCASLVWTLATAPAAWAKHLVVGPSGTGPCTFSPAPYGTSVCTTSQFCSIQSAVNAAHNGDEIDICPGTYSEQVVVTKNLNIFGPNPDPPPGGNFPTGQAIIKPGGSLAVNTANLFSGLPIAAILLETGVNNSQLSNITVDGAGNTINGCNATIIGIYYQNANGQVQNNEARNIMEAFNAACLGGSAIFVQSGGGGSSNVQLQFNSVHDYEKNGITANEQGTQANMTGNFATGSGSTAVAQNGIQLGFNATGQLEENTAANHLASGCSLGVCPAAGTNIIVPSTAGGNGNGHGNGNGNCNGNGNGNWNGDGNWNGNGHGNGNGNECVSVDNNVVDIADINIFLDEVANGDVSNNVVFQSVLDGIRVVGSFNNQNNQIRNNSIANSGEAAIYVDGQNNNINGNTVNGAPYGIFATSPNNQFGGGNNFYNTVQAIMDPAASSFTVSPYR
jgi:hypothetical protein